VKDTAVAAGTAAAATAVAAVEEPLKSAVAETPLLEKKEEKREESPTPVDAAIEKLEERIEELNPAEEETREAATAPEDDAKTENTNDPQQDMLCCGACL
jgi:hypothetical protein